MFYKLCCQINFLLLFLVNSPHLTNQAVGSPENILQTIGELSQLAGIASSHLSKQEPPNSDVCPLSSKQTETEQQCLPNDRTQFGGSADFGKLLPTVAESLVQNIPKRYSEKTVGQLLKEMISFAQDNPEEVKAAIEMYKEMMQHFKQR